MEMCPENDVWLHKEDNPKAWLDLYRKLTNGANGHLVGWGVMDPDEREAMIQQTWLEVIQHFNKAGGCVTGLFFFILHAQWANSIREKSTWTKHKEQVARERVLKESTDPRELLGDAEAEAARAKWIVDSVAALEGKIVECYAKLESDKKILAGLRYPSDWAPSLGRSSTLEDLAEKLGRRLTEVEVHALFVEWVRKNAPGRPEPTLSEVRNKLFRLGKRLDKCVKEKLFARERDASQGE
jgi:hypothetical protein